MFPAFFLSFRKKRQRTEKCICFPKLCREPSKVDTNATYAISDEKLTRSDGKKTFVGHFFDVTHRGMFLTPFFPGLAIQKLRPSLPLVSYVQVDGSTCPDAACIHCDYVFIPLNPPRRIIHNPRSPARHLPYPTMSIKRPGWKIYKK